MAIETTLARALDALAFNSKSAESKADSILNIIKNAGIHTEASFTKAVKAAYLANGWNAGAGRPKPGVKLKAVPPTVKQYMSRVRAGFRAKLPVNTYKTFHELRKGLREVRAKTTPAVNADPVMAGLRLVHSGELTGAPFHDMVTLYSRLPADGRLRMVAAVHKLVRQYQPVVTLPMRRAA